MPALVSSWQRFSLSSPMRGTTLQGTVWFRSGYSEGEGAGEIKRRGSGSLPGLNSIEAYAFHVEFLPLSRQ